MKIFYFETNDHRPGVGPCNGDYMHVIADDETEAKEMISKVLPKGVSSYLQGADEITKGIFKITKIR